MTVRTFRSTNSIRGSSQILPIKLNRSYLPIKDGTATSPWYRDIFRVHTWTWEQWKIAATIGLFIFSTVIERCMFKISVDRVSNYRIVLLLVILFVSIIIYNGVLLFKKNSDDSNIGKRMKLPHYKVVIMALMDTIQLCGFVLAAAAVSPTETVILLQISTPVIAIGSKYIFPNRKYSKIQIYGLSLIATSSLVVLLYKGISLASIHWMSSNQQLPQQQNNHNELLSKSTISEMTVKHSAQLYCCVLYITAASIHGVSTLYKEYVITDFAQAIDIYYTSCWLFYYQFVFAMLLSPLLYLSQGISSKWSDFPLHDFTSNLSDGMRCLFGHADSSSVSGVSGDLSSSSLVCQNVMWITINYVCASVVILLCIDALIKSGDKLLGRATSVAILSSYVILAVYDTYFTSSRNVPGGFFSTAGGFVDTISLVLLLVGMEVYGREPEPDIESITSFSPGKK